MPEDGGYAADNMDAAWERGQVGRVVGAVSARSDVVKTGPPQP